MSRSSLCHTTLSSDCTTPSANFILTPTISPPQTPKTNTCHSASSPPDAERPASAMSSTKARTQEDSPAIESASGGIQKLEMPATANSSVPKVKIKCKKSKSKRQSKKKAKKIKKVELSSSSSSSDSDLESSSGEEDELEDSETSDDTSSYEELTRKKRKKKAGKTKKSKPKSKRSKHLDLSTSAESSSSEDEDYIAEKRRQRKKKEENKRKEEESDETKIDPVPQHDGDIADLRAQIAALTLQVQASLSKTPRDKLSLLKSSRGGKLQKPQKSSSKKAGHLDYKRVDQLWDSEIHNFKLVESAEAQPDEFEEYLFMVRRRFDWENKFKGTTVDIKSKLLREALQEVMKDAKGVSLVEDKPSVDPNMLFLYLEELRAHVKVLKSRAKAAKKSKDKKRNGMIRAAVKVLVKYLDKDYDETKKTLYPMLEAGNITFDLLWALFKPNTIAYTPTYGNTEDPRCFKVDYSSRESSLMKGDWYVVQGRYLEYDGKSYGLGDYAADIESFKGPRKITSLAVFPLKYHSDPDRVKKELIERGKRFVSLRGMNYKFCRGMAFQKKKKSIAKVIINGRVMVDPALFRRINPNYPISSLKPKVEMTIDDDDDDDSEYDSDGSESDENGEPQEVDGQSRERSKRRYIVVKGKDQQMHVVEAPVDGDDLEIEQFEQLPDTDEDKDHEFSEEELLISSSVVLGFAFSEKLWLEFSISGIREIEWNEGAFSSLVLPDNQKSIVKALVESHKFNAAKTIDDVVQGKGRGLVAVLHGPPGTGKTLTAEGIAELLRCPLYMVSAGELGTDSRLLEMELQKILDIAHSWGAVLLLDEADVFLEKREVHDIHRNALVSIFLRLLEYFQGILFLTTNRVETFDDAFQSRIHVALRYGELTHKAKKAVWKMFLEKVMDMEKAELNASASGPGSASDATSPAADKTANDVKPTKQMNRYKSNAFTDAEFDFLAKKSMNGRQIKNAVRTAQALAVNENKKLSMEHIKKVLDVADLFEKDLKGGTGYDDAMKSYM